MFSPDETVANAAQQRVLQQASRRGGTVAQLPAPRCAMTSEVLQEMALARYMTVAGLSSGTRSLKQNAR